MTELEELKQRIEIETLHQRLDAAEKKIAILTETLGTLKDIQNSQQMSRYLASQERLLKTAEFLNSVSDNEKFDLDEQRRTAENVRSEKQALDSRIDDAVRDSREKSMPASNTRIAEALGKWQSKQPENSYEQALKYLCYRIENNEVTITGFNVHFSFDGEVEIPEVLEIPDVIDGCTVTKIGDNAFRGTKLKNIALPEHLYMIGKNAFSACTLGSIAFPDSLMSIGVGAFASCEFTEVHLENTRITVLPEKCFGWCGQLSNIVLPDSLLTIENNAFVECAKLDRLVVPEYTQQIISPFSDLYLRKSRSVAVLGLNTELVDICGIMVTANGAKNVVIYCLPDSRPQKYCIENGITCRHLSEFPRDFD
ncbi:MAG: leucine-rich repeat protein [Oscillospiraceae bacterium]